MRTHVYTYDDSGNMVRDGTYAYRYDPENRLVQVQKSGPYGTLTLGEALDSPLPYTTGGSGNWTTINGGEGHEDLNSAYSPSLAQGQESWLQTTVEGAGTFSFWAKIDPNDAGNDLRFYVDGTQRYSCGASEWEQFSWAVTGAGTHTLKWVCQRGSATYSSTGYVDDVGWTGALPALPPPEPAATNWRYLEYTYDASGRRIEKRYDYETVTKYVYDGDHCIAEYNAYNQLKRKYIYGPGVDQPICLIDTMTSPAVTSYYHFDGLGSVVALTNASGNTVEVYEYDVYGRVGATDANHPNRIMFTGREYDKETGLYYYRARYYNPQIGRFLQTDPVGYGAGMNMYAYCGNNSTNCVDPTGMVLESYTLEYNPDSMGAIVFKGVVTNNIGETVELPPMTFESMEGWVEFMASDEAIAMFITPKGGDGAWKIAGFDDPQIDGTPMKWDSGLAKRSGSRTVYWAIKALIELKIFTPAAIDLLAKDTRVQGGTVRYDNMGLQYQHGADIKHFLVWSMNIGMPRDTEKIQSWMIHGSPLAALAHELAHALDFAAGIFPPPPPAGQPDPDFDAREARAVAAQNATHAALYQASPWWYSWYWGDNPPWR